MSEERTAAWKADYHRNEKIGQLSPWGKLLFRYLGDARLSSRAGIFEVDLDEAAAATGISRILLPYAFQEIADVHSSAGGSPLIRFDGRVVWIVGRWKHYIAPGPKQRARIGHEFLARPMLPFWPEFFQRYGDVSAYCRRPELFKKAEEFIAALELAAGQLQPVRHYQAPAQLHSAETILELVLAGAPPATRALLPKTYAPHGPSKVSLPNIVDNFAQPLESHQNGKGIGGYQDIDLDTPAIAAPLIASWDVGGIHRPPHIPPPPGTRARDYSEERTAGEPSPFLDQLVDLDQPAPSTKLEAFRSRIAQIKNVFELRNWSKKHASEIEALPLDERRDVADRLAEVEAQLDLGPIPEPEPHPSSCECEICFGRPRARPSRAEPREPEPEEDRDRRRDKLFRRIATVNVTTPDMDRHIARMSLVNASIDGLITKAELEDLLPLVDESRTKEAAS